jgi:hypothetical protein
MKRFALTSILAMVLPFMTLTAQAAKAVQVDVLFMNHGPLQPSIKQIREILSQYGNGIAVSWYDFETQEGEAFMAKKGMRQHVPLVIWIDGKVAVPIGGSEVRFVGFPTGSGPLPFQGKWTMEDLRKALDQATGKK